MYNIYIYTYTYNNNILYTKEIAFIFSPFTKLAATDGTSFSPGALLGPLPPSQVVGPRCIPKPDAFFSVVVGKTKSGKDGQASVQKKWPRCSMYGRFTYKTGQFLGQM